jgi:hypothetical protein
MNRIMKRLDQRGITLSHAFAPIVYYVGLVRTGSLLFLSGQLCLLDGVPAPNGKLGHWGRQRRNRDSGAGKAIASA